MKRPGLYPSLIPSPAPRTSSPIIKGQELSPAPEVASPDSPVWPYHAGAGRRAGSGACVISAGQPSG